MNFIPLKEELKYSQWSSRAHTMYFSALPVSILKTLYPHAFLAAEPAGYAWNVLLLPTFCTCCCWCLEYFPTNTNLDTSHFSFIKYHINESFSYIWKLHSPQYIFYQCFVLWDSLHKLLFENAHTHTHMHFSLGIGLLFLKLLLFLNRTEMRIGNFFPLFIVIVQSLITWIATCK